MVRRVLVVDDSYTIRKIVGSVLTKAGYEISEATDGAHALTVLQRERFHLALVDFVMPRLNGFEFCRKVREDVELRSLGIVLMSAKADRIREHFLRQTGALDALTKPFDPRALLLTVEGALRKVDAGKGRREETEEPTPDETPSSSSHNAPPQFLGQFAQILQTIAPKLAALPAPRNADAIRAVLQRDFSPTERAAWYTAIAGSKLAGDLGGDLMAIPLAEVLQLLQLQQQSGVLTVMHKATETQIFLRQGLIDLAVAKGTADEFRLGRYLIESGRIDRSALHEFIEREKQRKDSRLLGEALVAENLLSHTDLEKALARQTTEVVYEVLRWTGGRFSFERRENSESEKIKLGLPIASILMEGFRRVDEWRVMESALGDFAQVLYRDPAAIDAAGATLSREERTVLMMVDGQRTVRQVIGALSMGSFDASKILYQLLQSRLIRKKHAN
jgi:CheY-like chemotaxis protein